MDRYEVDCYFCKNGFDALQADWCGCLTTEATFVCPGCSTCFCKAPAAYKQKFWSEAPPSVWDKKWARHREKFEPKPNLDPADIKRPLILVVEDEKDIQKMAIQKLDDMGYGVILAKNGVEGL